MKFRKPMIANAGEVDRERVVFRCDEDDDLGDYALFCCRSVDGVVRGGDIPSVYWFGAKKIKKSDIVILYTKKGRRSEKVSEGGITSHFFYWGRDKVIWEPDKRAILINTPTWTSSEPQPIDEDEK